MTPTVLAGLASASDTVRLSLHVLAATIFVGGQFTVAGLLPTVRGLGDGAPKKIAAAFGRLAWPAFAVLVATGFWNIAADKPSTQSTAWKVVLAVKIAVVVVAGTSAAVHSVAKSKKVIGITGGLAGLLSIVAVVLGVLLAG
jgi:putative copper export protein